LRRFLDTANDARIFSEEYDVRRGAMIGNLPQAFTHAEAILAACTIEKAIRRLEGDGHRGDGAVTARRTPVAASR
jgi:GH15 family glucan-1,4-alpha-glucosidase